MEARAGSISTFSFSSLAGGGRTSVLLPAVLVALGFSTLPTGAVAPVAPAWLLFVASVGALPSGRLGDARCRLSKTDGDSILAGGLLQKFFAINVSA